MAYEKNTWASGDVVTSAKLNHMENGIANAGSGISVDVKVWQVDSNGTLTCEGDFASALAKISQGIPLVAITYVGLPNEFSFATLLGSAWLFGNPNQIRLYYSTTEYYLWTENGITNVN